ncbi:MAG: hypothetical protein J2P47_03850 [Acetobacteraceae bacterium]|nr:hypothetical protein [Acetobacteraceae bacterium]
MSLRWRLETLHLASPEVLGWPSGTTIVVPATPGKRVAVYSAAFSSANQTQYYFASDNGFQISGLYYIPAANGMPAMFEQNTNGDPWWITHADRGLSLIVQGGPLFGDLYYLQVLN